MERIPNGRYTKEFREEAVKMATEGCLKGAGDLKAPVFTEVNVRELDKGF
jgi:hypothetical protein